MKYKGSKEIYAHIGIDKIRKCVGSCKTMEQLDNVHRLMLRFDRQYCSPIRPNLDITLEVVDTQSLMILKGGMIITEKYIGKINGL